jgi:hypothetical protein
MIFYIYSSNSFNLVLELLPWEGQKRWKSVNFLPTLTVYQNRWADCLYNWNWSLKTKNEREVDQKKQLVEIRGDKVKIVGRSCKSLQSLTMYQSYDVLLLFKMPEPWCTSPTSQGDQGLNPTVKGFISDQRCSGVNLCAGTREIMGLPGMILITSPFLISTLTVYLRCIVWF